VQTGHRPQPAATRRRRPVSVTEAPIHDTGPGGALLKRAMSWDSRLIDVIAIRQSLYLVVNDHVRAKPRWLPPVSIATVEITAVYCVATANGLDGVNVGS
jgi:hypothetical protein